MAGIDLLPAHFKAMNRQADVYAKRASAKRFANGDVRNAFLNNACSLISNYSVSLGLLMLGEHARPSSVQLREIHFLLGSAIYGPHVVRGHTGDKPLFNYYLAKQRNHLFIEVWNAFEDALRVLYREVVPTDIQTQDIKSERSRYIKPPVKVHIGIPTMWSRVSDVAARGGKVPRAKLKRMRAAVEFCAATRNTIHSNTFYSGPTRTLKLGKRTITLTDGEAVDFLSMAVIPLLINELAIGTGFIRRGIRTKRKISTPASLLPSPYG